MNRLRGAMVACIATTFLLVGTCARSVRASPAPTFPPQAVARSFFDAIRGHRYRAAYALLGPAVQQSCPYSYFVRRSRAILRFSVLELRCFDRGRHLVRFHVRGKLRLVYRGSLFEAVYAGRADLALANGAWRIAQVDLKPITQKRLGTAPPSYHL